MKNGLAVVGLFIVVVTASSAFAADDPAPTSRPDQTAHVERLFEFLTKTFSRQLDSRDWITRSIAVISLSRMPTEPATETILKQLRIEKHPVGQLVAWQAMLARAPLLGEAQFCAWEDLTGKLIGRGVFHGDLRIGLLEMLSSVPATRASRLYFSRLFGKVSSLDSSDIPTLIAMGRAVRAWGDAELVEQLIHVMRSASTAVRAELILQAAGVTVPWNRTPKAQGVYNEWWTKNKAKFTARTPGPEAWKKLIPQFIAAPVDPATVDPLDRKWRKNLELGALQLRLFDFAIAIDCSRSMAPEIDRLKRDIRVMYEAFSQISREPRVGLTLFAPGGEVEHMPLTGSRRRLLAAVAKSKIFGPVGEEEWAGALLKAIKDNRWGPPGEFSRRVIVLISDEPITEPQGRRCMSIATKANERGFRIYSVMIFPARGRRKNPLSIPFDRVATAPPARMKRTGQWAKRKGWKYYYDIAKATGADVIEARVPQGGFGLGGPPVGTRRSSAPSPVAIAPIYRGGGPTNRLLTMVLVDAMNPQYADRIEPFVKILLAHCQKAAKHPAERRKWGKPGAMEPNLN